MHDLDDAGIKTEIDQISRKIDAIMRKVGQLNPGQPGGAEMPAEDLPPSTPRPSEPTTD
jgi:hypothetical protein